MEHYLYKQIRDTGEYYYGIHSTDNLEDGYKGSGVKFLKKYNSDPSKFTMEVLEWFETRDELETYEEILVNSRRLEDPLCLNLMTGGAAGFHSEEAKSKMSESKKGKATWNKGLTGVQNHSEETKSKMSSSHKGVPKSAKTKAKMRRYALNRPIRTCPHCNRQIRHCYTRYHGDNCKHKRR